MLNYIWLGLIVIAVAVAGITDLVAGNQLKLEAVTKATVDSSKTAVELSIGLIGVMSLWLGLMRLAEKSGMIEALAWVLKVPMRWLFPDVPPGHPAMGAMIMNMAANMLGIANAATPLGLKAMEELEKLNPHKGTASNAMCTFLAINTSSIQLVPATAVAILAAGGSLQPTAIIGTALVATLLSTAIAIAVVKILEKLPAYQLPELEPQVGTEMERGK